MNNNLSVSSLKAGLFAAFISVAGFANEARQESWPSWRGEHSLGSAEAGNYPRELFSEKSFSWKAKLPGRGCSTPIVWDDKIVLTSEIQDANGIIALDWSGKPVWTAQVPNFRKGSHRNGSGTNPSPATDGKHIFTYFRSGVLAAIDFEGNIVWKKNIQESFGRDTLYWDLGTSPVLTKKDVVIAVMHGGASFLVAFEKDSGDISWKVDRKFDCPVEGDHSYATPIVYTKEGQEKILVWGAEHVTCHRPHDGSVIWSCGGFNPHRKSNWVTVGSPILVNDMVVASYGRGANLHGIRIGGAGDVTESHRIWKRNDVGCFVTSPVGYQDRAYILGDRGKVTCVEPKSGKTVWVDSLPKHRMKYYASPTIANGNLYAAREDGAVFVVNIEKGFELVSETKLDEQIIASPVPIANRILLRGESHVFCSKPGTE